MPRPSKQQNSSNYVRLIVGTVNDPLVAATNVYILKGLVQGTGSAVALRGAAHGRGRPLTSGAMVFLLDRLAPELPILGFSPHGDVGIFADLGLI